MAFSREKLPKEKAELKFSNPTYKFLLSPTARKRASAVWQQLSY